MEEQYVPTKTARKILGVTTQTLRNWDNSGKINTIRTPSGARLYNLKDIQNNTSYVASLPEKEKIAYCRVSHKNQIDDLERQVAFFKQHYPNHTLVKDIGSGINWKRKGLKTILDHAMSRDISEVVVAHRDRLCRFGFELLEYILSQSDVKLIVLSREENESDSKELSDDILSVISLYSQREKRRGGNQGKKSEIIPDNGTEDNAEELDRE